MATKCLTSIQQEDLQSRALEALLPALPRGYRLQVDSSGYGLRLSITPTEPRRTGFCTGTTKHGKRCKNKVWCGALCEVHHNQQQREQRNDRSDDSTD